MKRLVKFEGDGSLRAYCDLAIGDRFLVKGLRVVKGKNGLFVSMPRHQSKDGKWFDAVETLTRNIRATVQQLVLEAYEQEPASQDHG